MNKYLIYKDRLKRSSLRSFRFKKFSIKYISMNQNISLNTKFKTMLKFQKSFNNNYMSQINSRCLITNYPRAIIKYTLTSKSEFKKFISLGSTTGFTKSSW